MYDFDGDFETIYTGETDESISGLIDTYRGSENLKQWKDAHCSNINMASDGTKFKSFIEANETLLFFRKSMCRAQRLVCTKYCPISYSYFIRIIHNSTLISDLFITVSSRRRENNWIIDSIQVYVRRKCNG